MPDVSVTDAAPLEAYDRYYYGRGAEGPPLPVIRVRFADPLETWVYVDPADLRVVGSMHRFSRLERWLFNGLHSLDFAFWYDRRPLWDAGMIALSLRRARVERHRALDRRRAAAPRARSAAIRRPLNHSGKPKTNRLLPRLGRSSGVSPARPRVFSE